MNTERWNTTSIDVNKSGSNGRNFCKLVSLRPSSTKLQCTSRKKVTIVQVNVGSSQTLTFLHRVFLNVSSLTLFFTPTPGLFSTFTLLFFFHSSAGFFTPAPGESFSRLFQALCSTSRLPPSVSGTPVILGNTRYSCVAKINSEKPVGSREWEVGVGGGIHFQF